jgi:3-dehydroquinate dehydratase
MILYIIIYLKRFNCFNNIDIQMGKSKNKNKKNIKTPKRNNHINSNHHFSYMI